MIRWINHLSLATKLRFAIVSAAAAALLVASGLFITGEALGLRSFELMLPSLFIAGLVAYFLAARLQRLICAPINELLAVARNVRTTQKFTLRARKHNDDEMGALVDGFNGMLAQLESRDLSLQRYQNGLEKMVLERTMRLDAAVAEAREAVARAEAASRAKSEFLARMSHEIRTPMNAVLGMAELLRISKALDERQRRYAVTIHQSGSALLGIINDILDFSKMEVGKLELESTAFNIRDVAEEVVETLAERAHSKGLELMCDIPQTLATAVLGDPKRLRQILINLVGNAVKFTEHGEVRVSVRSSPNDLLDPSLTFEIADTGIGIRPENSATIFESFVQEDPSTTRQYGGTGLGLAISKQLVELMGGTIGVSSEPGKGSRFYFSITLAPNPDAPREPDHSAALSGMRILLVDDNANHRRILRQQLEGWDAKVTETDSGRRAIEILKSSFGGQFDAFVLDAQLPDHDGLEVLAIARKRPEFANTPALLICAAAAITPAAEEGSKHRVAWLVKPVRRSQLHTTLVSLVVPDLNVTRRMQVMSVQAFAETQQVKREPINVGRLLLVEDNPVNQEVALAILDELGLQADCAWNGEEALEKLAADRYDVILMDCHMPKLDGYATTRRLRELEAASGQPRLPVIALTANALSDDAEQCFAAGMDGYLSKPFSIDELYVTLKPYERKAVASPRGQPGSALDEQALKQIRALRKPGGPDLLKRIVALYITNSRTLIDSLRAGIGSSDAAAVLQAAHSLKSSSANVGATDLTNLCAAMEAAAKSGKLASGWAMLDRIIAEHNRVLLALSAQVAAA
jgi:two-component system, sensor histidine kinase and response regulator